jgi:diguanylate cyclase
MSQFQVLLPPFVAMLGLAFLLSTGMRHFYEAKHEQLAFGCLFGTVIVLGMTNPLSLGEGLIFDTRTLLIGAAVAFVGPVAGVIALGFGILCRIYLGGAGMVTGIIGMIFAYSLAFGGLRIMHNWRRKAVVKDVVLGSLISLSILALFALPYELALSLIAKVLPALLICNVLGMVAIGYIFRREQRFITEAQDHLTHSRTDALTNLLNRRGMDSEVDAAEFDATTGHALFYFDIDNFKFINDTFGHDAGDAALAIVAARIEEVIRCEAVFARHGGDEFSIYLPSLEAQDVQAVADRLCQTICSQKFSHINKTFAVTISIGGYWSKSMLPLQELLNRADAQLLLAKRAGKNRAQVGFDRKNSIPDVA